VVSLVGDRRVAIILVLVLCFAIVSIPQIGVIKAKPKTIVVPDDYLTIQEAIDYASERDTIFVKSGVYNESLLISGKPLSLIGEDSSTTIIECRVEPSGMPAVIQIYSYDILITGFTIRNNNITTDRSPLNGIILLSATNCSIVGNNIINNEYGIIIFNSNLIVISDNNMTENLADAIYFTDSRNSIISNNNITGNGITGGRATSLSSSDNFTLSGNILKNNSDGILLEATSYCKIFGNNITENRKWGIAFFNGSNNITVYENYIVNNDVGIDFFDYPPSANFNKFYHNIFLENSPHVSNILRLQQIWDNGFEGNYWSDYSGTDNNGDGIGDAPYVMDENNKDNYPLMNPLIPITQEPESFPTTWILIIIGIITVVGVAILLYFKKFKKIK